MTETPQQEALRYMRQLGWIDGLGVWTKLPHADDVVQMIALARAAVLADRAGRGESPDKQIRVIYEALVSVLCDPGGKCCIKGSDTDRYIVDRALTDLISLCSCFCAAPSPAEPPAAPSPKGEKG